VLEAQGSVFNIDGCVQRSSELSDQNLQVRLIRRLDENFSRKTERGRYVNVWKNIVLNVEIELEISLHVYFPVGLYNQKQVVEIKREFYISQVLVFNLNVH